MEKVPLLIILDKLTLLDGVALFITLGLMAYLFLSNKVHIIMVLLVLSAALISSTIPVVSSVASLTRWSVLILLLLTGSIWNRTQASPGLLLFWGYVLMGFAFLFRADEFLWQFQKGLLLVFVALAIPLAFSDSTKKTYNVTLVCIAVAASLFSLLNFASLPSHLREATRFSGLTSGAPSFTAFLGALLPFALWGFWNRDSKILKIICGLGFLLGFITLVFSGQRAGALAGLVGILPLFLMNFKQSKTITWTLLIVAVLLLTGYALLHYSSPERVEFLFERYSPSAGLSNREILWQTAFSEIAKNPFLGKGVGASEIIIKYSFHNTYLEVWYNSGVLGLMLFVGTQIYFFYRIFSLKRKFKDPENASILNLVLGYMLGFTVLCLVESIGAGASNVNIILFLFLGILVSNKHAFDKSLIEEEESSPAGVMESAAS